MFNYTEVEKHKFKWIECLNYSKSIIYIILNINKLAVNIYCLLINKIKIEMLIKYIFYGL